MDLMEEYDTLGLIIDISSTKLGLYKYACEELKYFNVR